LSIIRNWIVACPSFNDRPGSRAAADPRLDACGTVGSMAALLEAVVARAGRQYDLFQTPA